MAHLQTFCYKGFGENMKKDLWYSQAVRIADRIEISGQGKLQILFPTSSCNLC